MVDIHELVIVGVIGALLIAPWVGVGGTLYLWHLYRQDRRRPRSWVLSRFAWLSTVVMAVSFVIGIVATFRLLGISLGDIGILVLGICIVILEIIPSWLALGAYRIHRDVAGESSQSSSVEYDH